MWAKSDATRPDAIPAGAQDADESTASDGAVLCRQCGQRLAPLAARFVKDGASPSAVFANPHGRVFEILTLRDAIGWVGVGPSTKQHTWYPGYAWTIVLCAACIAHVGWRFDAVSAPVAPRRFFGLLRAAIVEVRPD